MQYRATQNMILSKNQSAARRKVPTNVGLGIYCTKTNRTARNKVAYIFQRCWVNEPPSAYRNVLRKNATSIVARATACTIQHTVYRRFCHPDVQVEHPSVKQQGHRSLLRPSANVFPPPPDFRPRICLL